MDFDRLYEKIRQLDCVVLRDESLSLHTTFQIGGKARLFVKTRGTAPLSSLVGLLQEEGVPWFLVGKGSNLLACDQGFEGCVVQIGPSLSQEEPDLELCGDGKIYAGAGMSLAKLCLFARDNSLTGLEFAWGIPGSVGGAVYMNAGAYGGEIKDVLHSVRYLDLAGQSHVSPAKELALSYRHSLFMERKLWITGAWFSLKEGNRELIQDQMEELYNRRREKQPLEFPNAGSTFKRPKGAYAAALIEQCGLKGYTVGGAKVSEKHSGFIINAGGATSRDVKELMRHVVRTVWEKTGYRLEPEIQGIPEGYLRELKG